MSFSPSTPLPPFRAAGGLVDAGSEYQKTLAEETAKLQRLYGGGDLTSFPEFQFPGELASARLCIKDQDQAGCTVLTCLLGVFQNPGGRTHPRSEDLVSVALFYHCLNIFIPALSACCPPVSCED